MHTSSKPNEHFPDDSYDKPAISYPTTLSFPSFFPGLATRAASGAIYLIFLDKTLICNFWIHQFGHCLLTSRGQQLLFVESRYFLKTPPILVISCIPKIEAIKTAFSASLTAGCWNVISTSSVWCTCSNWFCSGPTRKAVPEEGVNWCPWRCRSGGRGSVTRSGVPVVPGAGGSVGAGHWRQQDIHSVAAAVTRCSQRDYGAHPISSDNLSSCLNEPAWSPL